MISNSLFRRPHGWDLSREILATLPPKAAVAIADLSNDFNVSCRVIRNALNRLAVDVPLRSDSAKVRLDPTARKKAETEALEYWQRVYRY